MYIRLDASNVNGNRDWDLLTYKMSRDPYKLLWPISPLIFAHD